MFTVLPVFLPLSFPPSVYVSTADAAAATVLFRVYRQYYQSTVKLEEQYVPESNSGRGCCEPHEYFQLRTVYYYADFS